MALYETVCSAALATMSVFTTTSYAEAPSAYTNQPLQPVDPLESFEPAGDDLLEHAYQFFLHVSQTRPPSSTSSAWKAPPGVTQDQFRRGFEEWLENEFGSPETPHKRLIVQIREINREPEVIAEYNIWYGPNKHQHLYKFTYNPQNMGIKGCDPATGSYSTFTMTKEKKGWGKKSRLVVVHHKDPQSGIPFEKPWFATDDEIGPASAEEILKYQSLALKLQEAYKDSAPEASEKKE